MRAYADRTISLTVATLLTVLAAPESGLASDDLANLHNPKTDTRQLILPSYDREPLSNAIVAGRALTASDEPFASYSLQAADGPLALIWQTVKVGVLADMAKLTLCAAQEEACSKTALALRSVVDEARSHDGLARVGLINRAINLAIKPTPYPFWQSALETLSAEAGDCKGYAVAKYLALREAGFTERDVKLVIIRDMAARQNHAIVTVRLNGDWLVLDNRSLALVHDFEIRRAEPLYMLDEYGVRRFGQHLSWRPHQVRLLCLPRPVTAQLSKYLHGGGGGHA